MRVHCKNTIAISICSTPNSTFDKYTKLINHIASYLMSTLFHFHARYSFCQPFSSEPKNAQRTHTIQTASRYFFYSIFFCSFFRSASFAKLLLFIHLYQICCIYAGFLFNKISHIFSVSVNIAFLFLRIAQRSFEKDWIIKCCFLSFYYLLSKCASIGVNLHSRWLLAAVGWLFK